MENWGCDRRTEREWKEMGDEEMGDEEMGDEEMGEEENRED